MESSHGICTRLELYQFWGRWVETGIIYRFWKLDDESALIIRKTTYSPPPGKHKLLFLHDVFFTVINSSITLNCWDDVIINFCGEVDTINLIRINFSWKIVITAFDIKKIKVGKGLQDIMANVAPKSNHHYTRTR